MNENSNNEKFRIQVPLYVKAYIYNRFTETLEWLDAKQFRFFLNNYNLKSFDDKGREIDPTDADRCSNDKGMQVEKIETSEGIRKCLIKWPVKATTILKSPMLKYAAYLEFQTYAVTHKLSIQEARYNLIDEYPDTNCGEVYPESCLNLIRENKGCHKLTYEQFVKMKAGRSKLQRQYA